MLKRTAKLLISLLVWLWDCLCASARRLTGRPVPSQGVVLYYHAVKPHQRAAFGRQMDLLLSLAQPWRAEEDISGGFKRFAAVTFDDGFVSVVEHALPELRMREIPFTVFVPTGCWGQRPSWVMNPKHKSWDERVLSQGELRTLASEPLVTIGSHSITHPNFLTLDREAAAREFGESKRELETVLGKPVELFSFPHGAHNRLLVEQAIELGYRRLFTVEPVPVTAASLGPLVGRVPVEPNDWPLEFKLKALGAYRWMAKSSDHGPLKGSTRAFNREPREPREHDTATSDLVCR